ncbi:hypothetical protein QQS21_007947 [Conoideocrella luteorostrata]|uniref:HTH TFE/IIEalpha-type domain-containing protein n=1 Tax=Conoideocrella luteorostrata TaxID=1105319 RepID=A0AAJ0CJS0_9HYPO|nr:hypothetical protein QQS21_007947 [Conoideocrella luteorostrata]
MNLALTLIKSVMRGFYPTRDILVVDALMRHEACLRDDDLAYLMAIYTKDLHKICCKLREDRLLTVRTENPADTSNRRLNDQFKFISEVLPKMDAVHIPECDFDRTLSKAQPVIRDATHQRVTTVPIDGGANRPMAVKGLANTGPQPIAVNISTSEGLSGADKAAEKALREKVAQQNALPTWMSNSTVARGSFSGAAAADNVSTVKSEAIKYVTVGTLLDGNASAQIDGIFEKLKAEQVAERAREAGRDDGEDDDEDTTSLVRTRTTSSRMCQQRPLTRAGGYSVSEQCCTGESTGVPRENCLANRSAARL